MGDVTSLNYLGREPREPPPPPLGEEPLLGELPPKLPPEEPLLGELPPKLPRLGDELLLGELPPKLPPRLGDSLRLGELLKKPPLLLLRERLGLTFRSGERPGLTAGDASRDGELKVLFCEFVGRGRGLASGRGLK